jgi:ribosomal protein S18 acetylase RimI-like enzyme
MEKIGIRIGKLEDLPALVNLGKFSSVQYSKSFWKYQITHNFLVIAVDQDSGKIIGEIFGNSELPMEFYIGSLIIHPNYRKRHIGLRLIQALLLDAKNHALFIAHLHIRQSNSSCITLFQKLGSKTLNLLENFYSDLEKGLYMELYVEETLQKIEIILNSAPEK